MTAPDPADHRPAAAQAEAASARTRRLLVWLLAPVTVILVFWALRATASLFVPLVLAIFLALLVAPVDRIVAGRMPERFGWVGHLAAMAVILLVGLVFVGSVWVAAGQVIEKFPDGTASGAGPSGQERSELLPDGAMELLTGGSTAAEDRTQAATAGSVAAGDAAAGNASAGSAAAGNGAAEDASATSDGAAAGAPAEDGAAAVPEGTARGGETARRVAGASNGFLSRIWSALGGAGFDLGSRIGSWASSTAGSLLQMAGSILFGVFLVFFLTLLILIERGKWRDKAGAILRRGARQDAFESVGVIASRLRAYLLARTILGAVTAALYAAWLWIFGVDLLIVWALLAFLLNYIPTLGSLIAGVLPVLYAFVQKDPTTALLVAAGLLVIEQVMGNFVDPKVQGRQVALSPLVVLVTLVFWGWVWGPVGLFLAVPITVAAMIVFAHVPALQPVALLLSDERDIDGLETMAGRGSGT